MTDVKADDTHCEEYCLDRNSNLVRSDMRLMWYLMSLSVCLPSVRKGVVWSVLTSPSKHVLSLRWHTKNEKRLLFFSKSWKILQSARDFVYLFCFVLFCFVCLFIYLAGNCLYPRLWSAQKLHSHSPPLLHSSPPLLPSTPSSLIVELGSFTPFWGSVKCGEWIRFAWLCCIDCLNYY